MGFQYLTNHRTEALRLYRDILRATRVFVWRNEQGILWSDILKRNARQEFEQCRSERDPETITRMIIVGRDSLNQIMEKVSQKASSQ